MQFSRFLIRNDKIVVLQSVIQQRIQIIRPIFTGIIITDRFQPGRIPDTLHKGIKVPVLKIRLHGNHRLQKKISHNPIQGSIDLSHLQDIGLQLFRDAQLLHDGIQRLPQLFQFLKSKQGRINQYRSLSRCQLRQQRGVIFKIVLH